MNCTICREELQKGDRIAYNHRETFVFKPAEVADTVHPLKVSQEELLESRKEHTRTTVATTYSILGEGEIPMGAFGVRHNDCLQRTGTAGGFHAGNKHAIRWRNNQAGRKMH